MYYIRNNFVFYAIIYLLCFRWDDFVCLSLKNHFLSIIAKVMIFGDRGREGWQVR